MMHSESSLGAGCERGIDGAPIITISLLVFSLSPALPLSSSRLSSDSISTSLYSPPFCLHCASSLHNIHGEKKINKKKRKKSYSESQLFLPESHRDPLY